MTTDIFDTPADGDQPPVKSEEPAVTPTTDAALAQLMEIKNVDGTAKYATIEEGIKALAHAQSHIPTLQEKLDAQAAELAELKAKQESSQSVEEVVAKLLEQRESPTVPNDQQVPTGLDEASVAKLIRQENERIQREAVIAQNGEKVANALTELYGDNVKEEVAKKATELGTTPEKLGQLASESPDVVLSLFKAGEKSPAPASDSSVNTAGFQSPPKREVGTPAKSLLSGSTSKKQAEFMKEIRDSVYEQYGVQQ